MQTHKRGGTAEGYRSVGHALLETGKKDESAGKITKARKKALQLKFIRRKRCAGQLSAVGQGGVGVVGVKESKEWGELANRMDGYRARGNPEKGSYSGGAETMIRYGVEATRTRKLDMREWEENRDFWGQSGAAVRKDPLNLSA